MTAARERETDAHWMHQALAAAHEARARGEVPVGTCIVANEEILAVAGNRTRTDGDPTAHAEIVALRAAAGKLGNYRLTDAIVYSTVEPCVMCAGALIQARVRRLVYGKRHVAAGSLPAPGSWTEISEWLAAYEPID